ncbi:MAG: hypothetical protein KF730_05810 [Sphingomonas sp.]|uniref:hypothetical protein n=1 Tax=Sphingomonas sp. TaxID=28214 RepID=UPI0025FA0CC5|nr:hypothetical protein [Sphingomonas sp.]MBX3564078.1 hypothetical protein [Sphingomonas sp.]
MQPGPPDREPLATRFTAALRGPAQAWEAAAAIAVLIALAPLLTIAGAKLLIRHERSAIVRLNDDLAPRLAVEQAAQTARTEIAAVVNRPPMGATLETLARALPADTMLARAERTAQGGLDLEVTTVDPDKLRAAIRRAPELAGLRDSGQRQGDGLMLVSLHQDAQ